MAFIAGWALVHAVVFALPTVAGAAGRSYYAGWLPLGTSPGLCHMLVGGSAVEGRAWAVAAGVAVDGLLVVGMAWASLRGRRPGWGLLAVLVFSQGVLLSIGTLPAYFNAHPPGLWSPGTLWEVLIRRAGAWTARQDGWIQSAGWLASTGVIVVVVRRLAVARRRADWTLRAGVVV